jgi:hypothetical protein
LLKLRHIPAFRVNSGAAVFPATGTGRWRFVRFTGARGLSDILGILPPHGRLLAVETKMPGGRLTADQQGFLNAITQAGGLGLVIRDVRELAEALDALAGH